MMTEAEIRDALAETITAHRVKDSDGNERPPLAAYIIADRILARFHVEPNYPTPTTTKR